MKFIKYFLLITFAIFFIGGYLLVKYMDLNKFVTPITNAVTQQTKRELKIGNAEAIISLSPTIIIDNISFANPQWAANKNMATIKQIKLELSWRSILKKQLIVKNIIIEEPDIYLENNGNQNNWTFGNIKTSKTDNYNFELISTAHAKEEGFDFSKFAIKKLELNNGFVIYNNKVAQINNIKITQPNITDNFNATFDVLYENNKIKGETSVGSISDFLNHTKTYPVKLNLNAFNVKTDFNGGIKNISSPNPSVEGFINAYNPTNNFSLPEVTFSGRITASKTNASANIDNLNIAQNIIKGRINANLEGKPFIDANLTSDSINLQTLQKPQPLAIQLPSIIATAHANETKDEFDFKALQQIDGKITTSIKSLIVNKDLIISNVNATANLNNGILNINPASINFGQGLISASAVLNSNTDKFEAKVDSKNFNIKQLSKEFSVKDDKDFGILSGGNIDLQANLTSFGKNITSLTKNLNGQVIAISKASVIQTGKTDLIAGFLGSLINAAKIEKSKSNNVNISCAVVRADIKNGIVNFPKGIAINSDDTSIIASGDINLINKGLNIDLYPYSQKLLDSSLTSSLGGFIKIIGTINTPKISINKEQALKTIVSVLTTGGASVVGSKVVDYGSSPCYIALEGTGLEKQFPKPTITQKAYNEGEKELKKSINDLKDSFNNLIDTFKNKN